MADESRSAGWAPNQYVMEQKPAKRSKKGSSTPGQSLTPAAVAGADAMFPPPDGKVFLRRRGKQTGRVRRFFGSSGGRSSCDFDDAAYFLDISGRARCLQLRGDRNRHPEHCAAFPQPLSSILKREAAFMFMLLGGNEKKTRKEVARGENLDRIKELFGAGRFPVVTTQVFEGRPIAKVLGLVCCRGFDSEEAFFGMAALALKKGAQGIIGYSENVAFHPDGSKYFSCFGTAVMFAREARSDLAGFREPAASFSTQQFAGEPYAGQYSRDTAAPASRPAEEVFSAQPTEDEDPVLQRLLASQRRTPHAEWQ